MTDLELLFKFAQDNDQRAFADLVHRHVHWVNSMARRMLRDPAQAADATQAVFILLARKATSIRRGTFLSGWLFHVTRFAAAKILREESRRREHERKAAAMREDVVTEPSGPDWESLSPLLDELVCRLRAVDRQAVLLRFYEHKSFEEIGDAMHITEEAARKRVSRSIEKLRGLFARRGVTVAAAALAATLSAGMNESASAAVIATSVAQGSTAAALTPAAKAAGTAMFWTSLKPLAAVIGAILIGGGAVVALLQLRSAPPRAAAPTTAPTPAFAQTPAYSGRVVGPDSKPLAGARIVLINSDGAASRVAASAFTDATGNYSLPSTGENVSILAFAEGFGWTGINLGSQPAPNIEISLRKHSNILAHFVDPEGKPAAGVRVSISRVSDSRQRWQVRVPDDLQEKLAQTTDAQGDCTFEGMPENSVVHLNVLDPRYMKLVTSPVLSLQLNNDGAVWVGPSGIARSGDIKLQPGGTISGAVSYADTGKPAAGVVVRFQYQPLRGPGGSMPSPTADFMTTSAITDANGKYVRPQLRPGDYIVMPDSGADIGTRYNADPLQNVSVQANQETASQNPQLSSGGTIQGRVVANGKGVPGIRLLVSNPAVPMDTFEMRANESGLTGQIVRTRDDGTYEMHVPPGEQNVALAFPLPIGFVPKERANSSVTVNAGAVANVGDFELTSDEEATISGRVIDADGKPVAGARIGTQGSPAIASLQTALRIYSPPVLRAMRNQIAVSDADGSFKYTYIPGMRLYAQKADLISSTLAIPADHAPLVFRLGDPSLSSVVVHVRDNQSMPIHDARLTLAILSASARGSAQFTSGSEQINMMSGANGDCVIDQLTPNSIYVIQVAAAGFDSKSININDVQPGQRGEATVMLSRADSFVGGIVLNEKLEPAPGVVIALSGGGRAKIVTTDANGRFRAEGVVEGIQATAQVDHGNPARRSSIIWTSTDANVVIDRPLAIIARGVDISIASRRGGHREDETDAANAIAALGGVMNTDVQRSDSPITDVRIARQSPTDEQIKPVAQLKSLEQLRLAGASITDASMNLIGEFRELSLLWVTDSKITDAGIKPLRKLMYLQTLDLSGAQITDSSLSDFGQMQVLTSLTLSKTKITDNGLKQLSQLKYLHNLNLSGTGIGDQGLRELKAIHSLRTIDLRDTKTTDAGAGELQDALPGLKITR